MPTLAPSASRSVRELLRLATGRPMPAMVTEVAPSVVLTAPSSLVLAFSWRATRSVQELLRRWFLRDRPWPTKG